MIHDSNPPRMKKSSKLILSGVLTAFTVVLVGQVCDAIGVQFGLEQLGLTSIAGFIGSAKLFAGG